MAIMLPFANFSSTQAVSILNSQESKRFILPSLDHAEVLERYAKLNLAPYKGFVNPVMKEVRNDKGEVTDIVLDYTEGYADQMLRYSKEYSFLPSYNE